VPLFPKAHLGRRNGPPETRSFAGGGALLRWSKATRGCPHRQRSDRSAAMRMLQCNINPVLIFRQLWSRLSFLRAGLETENEFDHLGGGHFARLQYRPRSSQSIEVEADDIGSAKLLAIEPCPFAIFRPLAGHAPWSTTEISINVAVRQTGKRVFERRQNRWMCRRSWCQAFVADPAAIVIHADCRA
jgi:hypothetical protein